jgi:hypothetical protein
MAAVVTCGSGRTVWHLQPNIRGGPPWSLAPPKPYSFATVVYQCPHQSYVADQ